MPYSKKKSPSKKLRTSQSGGWFLNPETDYPIKDHGRTYRALLEKGWKRSEFKRTKSPRRRASATSYISPNKKLPRRTQKGTKRGEYGTGPGARLRGWGKAAPRGLPERRQVQEKCGDECFLLPDSLKFPICRKCRRGRCSCKLDCKGVRAANMRASQWGYGNVSRAAKRILRSRCGD